MTLGLGLTEGVESGLAVLGHDWAPIWATGGAAGISAFPVLGGIEHLTIFADHDENGVGSRAARECARRWEEAGKLVSIIAPNASGTDWADLREVAP